MPTEIVAIIAWFLDKEDIDEMINALYCLFKKMRALRYGPKSAIDYSDKMSTMYDNIQFPTLDSDRLYFIRARSDEFDINTPLENPQRLLLTRSIELTYVWRHSQIEVMRQLIKRNADVNVVDSDSYTPLCYAIIQNCCDALKLLIENGADVNARYNDGKTPLHCAAENDCSIHSHIAD